jgi:hypothetical protein
MSRLLNKFGQIWGPTETGILVPVGHEWEVSNRTSLNLAQVKGLAEQIEALYGRAEVSIPPTSGLSALLGNAKILGERWLTNQMAGATMMDVFRAMHLERIADAVLPLWDVPGRSKYLAALTSGELDFFKRGKSAAKDILWELELWSLLRESVPSAGLQDPPDIVLRLHGGTLGIACKKVYSESNIEKTISQAVKQVEAYGAGVVAINLDELVPADKVLKVSTERQMALKLQEACADFLRRHDRHFRKYLVRGRLIAVLACIQVVADVKAWRVAFNNARHATVWTIPGLERGKQLLLDQFKAIAGA